jgi:hypothetical protein
VRVAGIAYASISGQSPTAQIDILGATVSCAAAPRAILWIPV